MNSGTNNSYRDASSIGVHDINLILVKRTKIILSSGKNCLARSIQKNIILMIFLLSTILVPVFSYAGTETLYTKITSYWQKSEISENQLNQQYKIPGKSYVITYTVYYFNLKNEAIKTLMSDTILKIENKVKDNRNFTEIHIKWTIQAADDTQADKIAENNKRDYFRYIENAVDRSIRSIKMAY